MSEEENNAPSAESAERLESRDTQGNRLKSRPRFGWEVASVFLLIVVLLIAAYFRFTGLDWDDNYHLHPDERFLTMVASSLESVSDPISYLRTSESTLNP